MATDDTVAGVNPKDNITKTEVILRHDRLDQGDRSSSLTFTFDRAFGPGWGGDIEVPLVRFKGFGLEDQTLGDLQARVRYTMPLGDSTAILGVEVVLPSAGEASLGRGRYLVNPTAGLVLSLAQTGFLFAGYKHIWSVAGDAGRASVNESQPRLIAGYNSPRGWSALADVKHTHGWRGTGADLLDLEAEVGRTVGPATGVWFRLGTSYLESDRDGMILGGIRFIQ